MSNLLGIDVTLGFIAMISPNGLSLLSPIVICANLWMLSFDV
jgi:hypothetical protein